MRIGFSNSLKRLAAFSTLAVTLIGTTAPAMARSTYLAQATGSVKIFVDRSSPTSSVIAGSRNMVLGVFGLSVGSQALDLTKVGMRISGLHQRDAAANLWLADEAGNQISQYVASTSISGNVTFFVRDFDLPRYTVKKLYVHADISPASAGNTLGVSLTDARWVRFNESVSGLNVTPRAASWPLSTPLRSVIEHGQIFAAASAGLHNVLFTGEQTTIASYTLSAQDEDVAVRRIALGISGLNDPSLLSRIRLRVNGQLLATGELNVANNGIELRIPGEALVVRVGSPQTIVVEASISPLATDRNLTLSTYLMGRDGVEGVGMSSGSNLTLSNIVLPVRGQTMLID
ncbi:hypothetical protein CO046_02770 [Candidatus Peregrinibacteria bacterium CG_4_9_14_0_2_um_filter_53_11]|nr:MAG: hypothetical protein CO046_02770 [Candidatus Peregrinibacteria bacterium CG_4_9_14_0_2_um_filter_53_11]